MSVIEQVEQLIRPPLAERSYDLVEAQYRRESSGWVLRVFIDKPGDINSGPSRGSPVTLEDCETASRIISEILDASPDVIRDAYVLEVSSPGVNRILKRAEDFERFAGEKVKISLFAPLDAATRQKNFSGKLVGCKDRAVELDDVVSGRVSISLEAIAKANLDLV